MSKPFDENKHPRDRAGKFAPKGRPTVNDAAVRDALAAATEDATLTGAEAEAVAAQAGHALYDTESTELVREIVPGVWEVTRTDNEAGPFDTGGYVAVIGRADMPPELVSIARTHGYVVSGGDGEAVVGDDSDEGWRVVALTCPDLADSLSERSAAAWSADPHRYSTEAMLADIEKWGNTDFAADYRQVAGLPSPTATERTQLDALRARAKANAAAAAYGTTSTSVASAEGTADALEEAVTVIAASKTSTAAETACWQRALDAHHRSITAGSAEDTAKALGERAGWIAAIEATRGGARMSPAEIAARTNGDLANV